MHSDFEGLVPSPTATDKAITIHLYWGILVSTASFCIYFIISAMKLRRRQLLLRSFCNLARANVDACGTCALLRIVADMRFARQHA